MTRILILLAGLVVVGPVYAEKYDRSEIAERYSEVGDISEMTFDERVCLIGKTHANIPDWAKTSHNYIRYVHENKRTLKMTIVLFDLGQGGVTPTHPHTYTRSIPYVSRGMIWR